MTLRDLSAASGVSIAYLSGIETGRRLPGLDVLDRLAGAFDLTVAGLIEGVYPWGTREAATGEPTGQKGAEDTNTAEGAAPGR